MSLPLDQRIPYNNRSPMSSPICLLQGICPTKEGSNSPVSPVSSVEYVPLDRKTRSWEVERSDVKVEKIIRKGAFGQVAKGTARNLPFRSAASNVTIKMVKGKFVISSCFSLRKDDNLLQDDLK